MFCSHTRGKSIGFRFIHLDLLRVKVTKVAKYSIQATWLNACSFPFSAAAPVVTCIFLCHLSISVFLNVVILYANKYQNQVHFVWAHKTRHFWPQYKLRFILFSCITNNWWLVISNAKFTLSAIFVLLTTRHSLHLRQKEFLASSQELWTLMPRIVNIYRRHATVFTVRRLFGK